MFKVKRNPIRSIDMEYISKNYYNVIFRRKRGRKEYTMEANKLDDLTRILYEKNIELFVVVQSRGFYIESDRIYPFQVYQQ